MSILDGYGGVRIHWRLLSSYCLRLSVLSRHSCLTGTGYVDGASAFAWRWCGKYEGFELAVRGARR